MAAEMTVSEVKRLKSEFEKDVASMVREFQNKTGCTVDGLHGDCFMKEDFPNERKQEVRVFLRVSIM